MAGKVLVAMFSEISEHAAVEGGGNIFYKHSKAFHLKARTGFWS